jgi:hypothetical protein
MSRSLKLKRLQFKQAMTTTNYKEIGFGKIDLHGLLCKDTEVFTVYHGDSVVVFFITTHTSSV